ncbi:MAG: hypothetical protein ABW136_06965 [Steroidobacteraceae bacterium]
MNKTHLVTGAAIATLAITATSLSQTPSAPATPTPQSAEEATTVLMRGQPPDSTDQPSPRGADGKPDFTGFWRPVREPGKPGGNLAKDYPDFLLPFNDTGKRAVQYSYNHTVDPEALCILGGIPRHNGSGLPFEVLHTPNRIGFTYNYNTSRRISIGDDLKLDAGAPRRYFGTAVARWDGDTLVIETTRLFDTTHDKIWLDENGNPTSNETHVVERWTRPDFNHFRLEMTVTDPKYYAEPIRFVRTWAPAPEGQGQQEYACNESNLATDNIGPGAGVIGPDGNRGYGKPAPLPNAPPGPEAYGL